MSLLFSRLFPDGQTLSGLKPLLCALIHAQQALQRKRFSLLSWCGYSRQQGHVPSLQIWRMRLIALVHVWLRRSAEALAARSLARLLAQRHLLFSECASDGCTSLLGEACALFRFNGVKRYGSKYGTTPDGMYTSVLPFLVVSRWNDVVVKLFVLFP